MELQTGGENRRAMPAENLPSNIQKASEAFTSEVASHLTSSLQATANGRLVSLQLGNGAEQIGTMEGPYCQVPILVKNTELQGAFILQDSFAAFLVQVMLGAPATPPDMPVPCLWTDLERDLLSGFLQRLLDVCGGSWETNEAPGFSCAGGVSCGDLANEWWQGEQCAVAVLEMEINGMIGNLALLLAGDAFENPGAAKGPKKKEKDSGPELPPCAVELMGWIADGEVEGQVELAGPSMPAVELAALEPGQVILLDYGVESRLKLLIEGRQVFEGTLTKTERGRRALGELVAN